MTWFNYMQAIQKQENPEGDLGRALLRVTQLEAEVARLNENANKLNKALEQAVRLGRVGFYGCFNRGKWTEDETRLENDAVCPPYAAKDFPELAAWAPHGWDIVGRVGVAMQPAQPYVEIMGHYFVPAKPKPRTWTGTVSILAEGSTAEPWNWGDDVEIEITEVLR